MAMPTLTRTWQFQTNVNLPAYGNIAENAKRWFWNFKNALTTFSTNPWVCVASSSAAACLRYGVDSLGPPGPAYDLWGASFDATKLHYREADGYSSYSGTTDSKHSWIVLRNTALDTTYDLCIDLYINYNPRDARHIKHYKMFICRSYNLTGTGSVTARPSPNSGYSEPDLRNGNQDNYGDIHGHYDWDMGYRMHFLMSEDGLATRIITMAEGYAMGYYAFERIEGAPTEITNPVYAVGRGRYDNGAAITWGWLHDTATQQYDSHPDFPANWFAYYLTGEGEGGGVRAENWYVPTEATEKWPLCPVGVAQTSAPYRGRIGYLADLWWGNVTANVDGTPQFYGCTYPEDGSRQFVQTSALVHPWDGGNFYTHAF